MKQYSSESSSSDSDSSDKREYKIKSCDKNKKYWENRQDPIKVCAKLAETLLTTEYKSKILKFKLDEYPLHRRIYFLTYIESLEMLFSMYKETCEVLLDYPTIGVEDIKYYVKKEIGNILHANIDVHSRRLISEFPVDGVKSISKLQSHCANMTFSEKRRYDRIFQKVTNEVGGSLISYIKIFHNAPAPSVSGGNSNSKYQLMHIFLDNFHQGGKYIAQIASHQA